MPARSAAGKYALAGKERTTRSLHHLQQETLQEIHGLWRAQRVVTGAPELGILLHLRTPRHKKTGRGQGLRQRERQPVEQEGSG
jgi:hypothetical protein